MKKYETNRLVLREIQLEDAPLVEKYASDDQLAKTTLNVPSPYPKGSAINYLTHTIESQKAGKLRILAVILKETNALIGLMSIGINITFQRGELGYWIGRPYWGKGYGTEAARKILEIGFNELKLNKVFAKAFLSNPGSYRIMEKIGLKQEGMLKEHVYRFNAFHDIVVYGMTVKDFKGI